MSSLSISFNIIAEVLASSTDNKNNLITCIILKEYENVMESRKLLLKQVTFAMVARYMLSR